MIIKLDLQYSSDHSILPSSSFPNGHINRYKQRRNIPTTEIRDLTTEQCTEDIDALFWITIEITDVVIPQNGTWPALLKHRDYCSGH